MHQLVQEGRLECDCLSVSVNTVLAMFKLTSPRRRSQIDFTLRCMFPRYSDWDVSYTRKGLIKYRVLRTLKYLATFSTLLATVWSFKAGKARSKACISSALTAFRYYVVAGVDGIRSRI
jgi:hypothetical protein